MPTELRPALAALVLLLACAAVAALTQRRPAVARQAPRPAPAAAGAPASSELLFARALDLNAATVDDLAALPGIGPVRAERIAALRAELGCFAAVDDLLDVSGIGDKTLARLRPLVRIGPCERRTP